MDSAHAAGPRSRPFTEKSFYLGEFRDRTLAIAAASGAAHDPRALEPVLKELEANPTGVVLIGSDPAFLAKLLPSPPLAPGGRLEGEVWRGLRLRARVGVRVDPRADLPQAVGEIARRLRVTKLVWLDEQGGLTRDGQRQSFVDLEELTELLERGAPGESPGRRDLLEQIETMLRGGLPAFNLCSAGGLGDELFTYAGSGTLFTRRRYVEVRPLGIDDYDAADDLIGRGVSEGYLAERSPEALDQVFANGFGAFVEGRHLAGIGALLPCREASAGEIVSLYTLTRFLGEGIGGHLLTALCDAARERGFGYVFACTTTERVAGFFQRNGFRRVAEEDVPPEKWRDYDPRRRPRVRCVRRELA